MHTLYLKVLSVQQRTPHHIHVGHPSVDEYYVIRYSWVDEYINHFSKDIPQYSVFTIMTMKISLTLDILWTDFQCFWYLQSLVFIDLILLLGTSSLFSMYQMPYDDDDAPSLTAPLCRL